MGWRSFATAGCAPTSRRASTSSTSNPSRRQGQATCMRATRRSALAWPRRASSTRTASGRCRAGRGGSGWSLLRWVPDGRTFATSFAAAELAVPDGTQLPAILDRLRDRASSALLSRTAERRRQLTAEARALVSWEPDLGAARQRTADLVDRGHRALSARVERHRATLDGVRDGLRALGPTATLARGY